MYEEEEYYNQPQEYDDSDLELLENEVVPTLQEFTKTYWDSVNQALWNKADFDKRALKIYFNKYSVPIPILTDAINLDGLPEDHFLNRYTKYSGSRSDAYPEYNLLSGLMILSCCANKDVKLMLAQGTIRPNLWVFLLGDSTVARKSTATKFAIDIINELNIIDLAPKSGSIQGVQEQLSEKESRVFQYIDEASGIISSLNKRGEDGYREFLCDLYSNSSGKRRLAKGKDKQSEFEWKDAYFPAMWSTVPSSLFDRATPNDVDGGLLYRFIITNPGGLKDPMGFKMYTEDIDEDKAVIMTHVKRVQEYCKVPQIFTIDPEALSYINRLQMEYIKISNRRNETLFNIVTSRLIERIFKISMLLEIGRFKPNNHITLETTKQAAIIANMFLKDSYEICLNIMTRSKNSDLDKVRETIKMVHRIGRSELINKTRLTRRILDELISTLIEAELIKEVNDNSNRNKLYYEWC